MTSLATPRWILSRAALLCVFLLSGELCTAPAFGQPAAAFDFISNTIGGNSGSPAVNRDLELVGLNFDRNMEGRVRDDFLILPSADAM